ncbi:SagB/ThcOx family dehydrogenase [Bacteroides sp. 214]|uniref:SagB/ThcOx family dehydrogenase n=1 Tax=Bacteroides sp. 214 TaxID=2302935 RepID=UPI0013D05DD9|nr:SagB/ThcOx family dehydrogenase [Bacteroides sp. 214]NDW11525.1 SagB/ThcOx family dehydrogenase [Bacteroides sp. 214]
MKKISLLFALLMIAAIGRAADKVIELKKPNMERSGTVMKALAERKSTREFSNKALSIADLSDVLWAANGINRPADGKRTAPSAMNRQDVDIYVLFKEGAYLYDAKGNKLTLVAEGNFIPYAASQQAYVNEASVVLLLVSNLSKLGDPKNEMTRTMGAADAGIISQNISIFCAAANLATVPRGYMEKDKLKAALKLKESEEPILNHPIGYFK